MKIKGFSLIELMVTVTVMTILTLIAYPSYNSHIAKTRRTDAISLLLQDAGFLERYYTETGCYRTKTGSTYTNPTLPYLRSPTTGSTVFYNISLDTASSTKCSTFTLTADPTGTPQASDGTLTLDNTGKRCWSKNTGCNPVGWQ